MAIIPRVTPQVLPPARLNATPLDRMVPDAAFGGGAGDASAALDQGLSPIRAEATRIAQQEFAHATQAVLDTSRLGVGQLRQNLTAQFQSLQGLDAPGQEDDYRQQWAAGVQKIRDSLSSDELRAAFDHATTDDQAQFNEALVRHSYMQMQVAEHQTYQGNRELLFNDIASNAGDEPAVQASIAKLNKLTSDYGTRTGQPQALIDAETARDTSNAHATVIAGMAAAGDPSVSDYLAKHESELIGQQRTDAVAAVRAHTVQAQSQQLANQFLFGGALAGSDALPNEADVMKKVRAIADPDVQDATVKRVQQAFEQAARQRQYTNENAMIDMKNALDQNGGDWTALLGTPQWRALPPSNADTIKRYGKAIASGENIATDWNYYNDIMTEASTPATRATFLQRNLSAEALNRLAPPLLEKTIDLQAKLRGQDDTARDSANQELGQIQTTNQVVTNGLHAIGIGIDAKKRAHDDPIINNVFAAVDQQVSDLQARQQRKATTTEVQSIVDDLLTQHIVSSPGTFYGRNQTSKRLFDMGPDDQLVLSAKDIPAAQLPALDNLLRTQGRAVTDANRVAVYQQYLSQLMRRGSR